LATKTYQEQLEEVQTAISVIVTKGQEYTIAGRTYTRASLAKLIEYEKYLRAQADLEADGGGGIRTFRGVPWR
jgi:hypothetical protein